MNELLGRMLLMTIREDISCPHDTFMELWHRHDLPERDAPRRRTPEDAFRVATPKKQWKHNLTMLEYKGGQTLTKNSRMEVVLVYSQDSRLAVDIHHANRAILYLEDSQLKVRPLTPLLPREQEYIDEVLQTYDRSLNRFDGSQFRNAIHRVMEHADTLTYRDGSYLIPQANFQVADSISGIVRDMAEHGSPSTFWDIPYVDNENTRQQIEDALLHHIQSTSRQALEAYQKLKRKKALPTALTNLERTIKTYERLLGKQLPGHWDSYNRALLRAGQ